MKQIEFIYRNHKGETEVRHVTPQSLDFLTNVGYGYQPGWFLTCYDHDKDAIRSFRLSNIILSGGKAGDSTAVLERLKLEA